MLESSAATVIPLAAATQGTPVVLHELLHTCVPAENAAGALPLHVVHADELPISQLSPMQGPHVPGAAPPMQVWIPVLQLPQAWVCPAAQVVHPSF